ncbi:hypothetical protein [Paenibacillus pabuli]|uniref:hypothetical protein n=1 Tax=Paenibacillus pabuli TaxID=1472 RepID=UPI001FE05C62|nr:hypothetical protein [Paenibacillus pabuli]MEC0129322.1 hypothetical protein [Paenibacillus pabuli]
MDVFSVADIIINRIKREYSQDVAIVGYYGSYLQGRATERSDLDFFFIPATTRGKELELQFIIDGISFDFYPIEWSRAERMAALEDWNTTIIADCKLLYVRSEEDRERFLQLRENIAAMKDPSRAGALINQAEHILKDCFLILDKLRRAGASLNLSYSRTLAQEIAGHLFKCLGYMNQTYYTRSWGHYREQVSNLSVKPDQLDVYLDTIMFSHSPAEIVSACEQLVMETLELLSEQRKQQKETRSYPDRMKGFYEEERGMLNKLLTACEKRHYETAFFVAIGTQDSIARMLYAAEKGRWPGYFDSRAYRELYDQMGYPDLTNLLDPADFEPLRIATLQLIEKLEHHITSEGVPLNNFTSVAEFESFYRS